MLEAILILVQAPAAAALPMPSFLAGCWEERREDGGWTEECWTSARGELMLGSGRDGSGTKVRHWEWMRVDRNADGVPTFHGSPKGAKPVAFTAVESTAGSITFVNAAHDYPQRVRYVRTNAGIEAEVSLADGSKPMRWSYRPPALGN